jgi:acetylornithine deacetylase/succinyl-diaminopimelate desuccinylase-like protein
MAGTVYEVLAAGRERILAELIEFATIPSVSTDPAHRTDIDRAAGWVAERLAAAGPFTVQILPTARHPVVYAEWLGAAGAPTVVVYGHYDVQPPDPLEKWATEPFKPTVREGRLYSRGVSDDKGPMLIPIKVAEAFFAAEGALPINLKCLFEGEEEIGSPSLEPFIREHADRLAGDLVLSADGAMWRISEPSITVACRGMAGLELSVYGPAKDLHSGRHGGGVANPLHALASLIDSLHTADGRVAVAGFYDAVQELDTEESAAIAALPFDEAAYLAQVGSAATFGERGYSTLERQWTRPTLEVNGLWGGYEGAGSKTIVPAEAHAKLSCRLVRAQEPQDILEKVAAHLRDHLPPGVRLKIVSGDHAALPYEIPAAHPGLAVARAALCGVYGQEPVLVRMGGTVPICDAFRRILGMETVFFSFSTADEDFHAPNEFFRINRLWEGLEAWARYWELLGAAGPAGAGSAAPAV